MNSYLLHKVAKNQVLKIWKNTYDKWGIEQADKYIDELYAKLDNLDKQLIRESSTEYLPGLKFFHYIRHYVFFSRKGRYRSFADLARPDGYSAKAQRTFERYSLNPLKTK